MTIQQADRDVTPTSTGKQLIIFPPEAMQIKRRVLRELTTKQSISHACANTGGTTVHCQCVLLLCPDGKSCIDLYYIFTLCTILLQNWRLLHTSRYSLRTAKNLILNVLFTHHFFGSAVGCISYLCLILISGSV